MIMSVYEKQLCLVKILLDTLLLRGQMLGGKNHLYQDIFSSVIYLFVSLPQVKYE